MRMRLASHLPPPGCDSGLAHSRTWVEDRTSASQYIQAASDPRTPGGAQLGNTRDRKRHWEHFCQPPYKPEEHLVRTANYCADQVMIFATGGADNAPYLRWYSRNLNNNLVIKYVFPHWPVMPSNLCTVMLGGGYNGLLSAQFQRQ